MNKSFWSAVFLVAVISGCGGDSSSGDPLDSEQDRPLNEIFAETAVESWLGYDFSTNHPDGTTDSDGDGDIDTNDAVVFVETFQELGYSLPPTTVPGLYDNEYTGNGYAETGTDPSVSVNDFNYTLETTVTEDDLKNMRWELMSIGDLIFVDYDKDFIWDSCAIYLGAYDEYDHAAFFVSDYYDQAVVVNLDWESEIINLDISYGFSALKRPDYDNISVPRE
ncbi:hypothetical protein [uncultured Desulfuromusa sp.]|uniref:hypothetical protein n=1 Tax=uncultured Desulfuromusa sp. TaxID=219183 RepID=UPI002AA62413|nr:hypothetical protein [uncultured Desulfuromusa sp.]